MNIIVLTYSRKFLSACSILTSSLPLPPPSLSVMLMAVYFIIATAFFYHPNSSDADAANQAASFSGGDKKP